MQSLDSSSSSGAGNPYASGGGVVVLEHAFAARTIAALLLGGPIQGLGDEFAVVGVRFQAGQVSPVDDVLVTGRSESDVLRRLAVAVRRDPTVGASDEGFVALTEDMPRLVEQAAAVVVVTAGMVAQQVVDLVDEDAGASVGPRQRGWPVECRGASGGAVSEVRMSAGHRGGISNG